MQCTALLFDDLTLNRFVSQYTKHAMRNSWMTSNVNFFIFLNIQQTALLNVTPTSTIKPF